MSVTLSITDNQNGMGATVTILGSSPTATNTLWVMAMSGNLGAGIWAEITSRQGDGLATLPLGNGVYWSYCSSELSGLAICSNLVLFRVSDGQESVLYRCLLAVQAQIRNLSLPLLSSNGVLIRQVVSDRDVGQGRSYPYPTVQISPFLREQMPLEASTNLRDQVAYPVLVVILAAENTDQDATFPTYLQWRERIARAFRNQHLPSVPEIYGCQILPQEIVSAEAYLRHSLFSSALLLEFYSREPRGVGN